MHELEFVRAYIEIEKARFEDLIDVIFHLPDETDFMIPILVLQPIVENAIIHGILPLPQDEGGRIEITVDLDDYTARISVKDNGVGMEAEKSKLI